MTSFPSEITMNQSLALSHIFLFAAVVIYRIYDSRTVQPTVRNPGVAIPIRISAHNNRRQASFKDHPADIGFRYIFSVNISIPLFHEIDSFVSFGTTSASPIIGAARAADQSDQPCDGNRRIVVRSRFKQGRCLYRLFDQIPLNCRRRDYVRGPVIVKFIISQQLRNGYRRATSWISTMGNPNVIRIRLSPFCF